MKGRWRWRGRDGGGREPLSDWDRRGSRKGQEDGGDTEGWEAPFLSAGPGQEVEPSCFPRCFLQIRGLPPPFLLPLSPPSHPAQPPGDPQLPHSGRASGFGKSLDRRWEAWASWGHTSVQWGPSGVRRSRARAQTALDTEPTGSARPWRQRFFLRGEWGVPRPPQAWSLRRGPCSGWTRG